MITRADVIERVREWGLTEEVIEKDYVLGWLLWGIGSDEVVVRSPVLKPIAHPYPDSFPPGATIRCYSFDELFAEKIRAMAQRGRPRDLYDIVNLFRRNDLRMYPDAIRSALTEKCAAKSIAVPAAADFVGSPLRIELESEWSNMLGHQLAIAAVAVPAATSKRGTDVANGPRADLGVGKRRGTVRSRWLGGLLLAAD